MSGKVYYIDFMQDEIKEGNMGVMKCDMRGFTCVIHLPRQFHEIGCAMYAVTLKGENIYLTDVYVMQGRGQVRCDIDEAVRKEWKSIRIQVSAKKYGICRLQKKDEVDECRTERNTMSAELNKEAEEKRKIEHKKNAQEIKDTFIESLPPMKTDKWEQLLQMFPQVHIFPEAETIVIKPKDMIILTKEYQELATNSFVLHAYYNYRQLLLIRYQNKAQRQYYIGVPGIYYEREKRIAMLFGFEGFENGEARLAQASGKSTYTGCFGYYVKQVEI